VQKIVEVRSPRICPRNKGQPLRSTNILAQHTVVDLAFTRNGCRKTTVKYTGTKSYCPKCQHYHSPPAIRRLGRNSFGRGFQAWTAYQRIALRLPYRAIAQVISELFSEHVSDTTLMNFVGFLAEDYSFTENLLSRTILASPFIHADETGISIRGSRHYVWVITNGTHVVFQLTETRETTLLRKTLKGYEGVLISDFYPGFDSMECRQQKCLGHLIRDINDDLWKNPFNQEYESFVAAVRDFLVPLFTA